MKYLALFVGTLFSLFMVSCAYTGDGGFPQVADPPPFDFVDGEELRSRMHQLAFALQRLDSDLYIEYDEISPNQRSVVGTLRDIERIGESLQDGDLNSKHPFLLDGMRNFLADVSRAQMDAERNRYYMAGRIAGACVSCHRANY